MVFWSFTDAVLNPATSYITEFQDISEEDKFPPFSSVEKNQSAPACEQGSIMIVTPILFTPVSGAFNLNLV